MRRILLVLFGLAMFGLAGFLLLSAPQPGPMERYVGLTGDKANGEQVFWA